MLSKDQLHFDLIISTHREQVKTLCMVLSWHALNSTTQVRTHCHTEKQGLGYLWLSKKLQAHPIKPAEAKTSFRNVTLLPAKLDMLFPTHF